MRLPPKDIAKQRERIADFERRSRSYKSDASAAEHRMVALVGWEGPRPRDWGDNIGAWPVTIKYGKSARQIMEGIDAATPHVRVLILEHVWVQTEAHARRLKAALDNRLLGEQEAQEHAPLRYSWRDVNGVFQDETQRAMWWSIILAGAVEDCRRGGEIIETVSPPNSKRRGSH